MNGLPSSSSGSAKKPSPGSTPGDGRIKRIKLERFLTHGSVEVFPGDHLNLIIGPNGSGKSSLVSAICLGLGGKVSLLDRQKKVAQFVKHGEQNATIEIDLQHGDGVMTVRREILANPNSSKESSTWRINGKVRKEKDVLAIVKQMHIQISNLCQFLPQDRVSEFARMTPTELLTATEEAVGGEGMLEQHQELIKKGGELKILEAKEANADERVAALEGKLGSLESDYERAKQQSAQRTLIEVMEQKLPWMEYQAIRDQYEEEKKEEQVAKEQLQSAQQRHAPATKEWEDAKQKVQGKAEAVKALNQVGKQLSKGVTDSYKMVDSARGRLSEFQDSIAETEAEIKRSKSQKKKMIQEISQYKQLLESSNSEEFVARRKEIVAELSKLSTSLSKITREVKQEDSEMKRITAEIKVEKKKLDDMQNASKQVQINLQRYDKNAWTANEWLANNGKKFKKNIFPPMCTQIELKDGKDADIVESMIPMSDLTAFLAETAEDQELFLQDCKKSHLMVNAVKDPGNYGRKNPRWKLEDLKTYGCQGVVSDLFEAPAPIMRYLKTVYYLDQVPVFSVAPKGSDLAEELFTKYGITRMVVGKLSIGISRSQFGKRHIMVKESAIWEPKLIGASVDREQEQRVKERYRELQSHYGDHEAHLQKIKAEESALKKSYAKLKSEEGKLTEEQKKFSTAKRKIQTGETKLANLEEGVADLVRELENNHKKIESESAKYVKEVLKYNGLIQKRTEANLEIVQSKLEHLQLKMIETAKKEEVKELRASLQVFVDKVEKCKVKAKELKVLARNKLIEAREKINDDEPSHALHQAFQLHPDDVEELKTKILEEQAKLACQNAVDPGVIAEYEDTKEEVTRALEEMEHIKGDIDLLRKAIDDLKEAWLGPLEALLNTISDGFSEFMKRLNCAGEVSLRKEEDNYEDYGIEILVRFREKSSMQRLSGSVHSGGEKSVSTMLYLMALQSLTKCPFRVVDEINQGMDARNERKVYSQVMHSSENTETSQYFLISPKLLPNLEYRASMRILFVFNGPHLALEGDRFNSRPKWQELVTRKKRKLAGNRAVAVNT